jgi:hypothetical protein
MSKIDFTQLNTVEAFKAFLSAYHGQLSDTRSFPPLGLQKALHTAAPVFGYNDWHVMSAALEQAAAQPLGSMTEAELQALGLVHGVQLVKIGEAWGWSRFGAHVGAWENPCEALADGLAFIGVKAPVSPKPEQGRALETAEPERIHVVMVNISELENADEGARVVANDTYAFRNWDDAQEFLVERIKSKMMNNDRDRSEALEFSGISVPDEDDGLDEMDDDELIDWIGAHNQINDLADLLSHLDYGLTTATLSDTWI